MLTRHHPWDLERAREIITRNAGRPGATLPILHELQDNFGFVPEALIPMIAEALNLSRAEVWGTFTFYHDFRRSPGGKHVLKLCRAEACQAVGGEALATRAENRLGVKIGETTADGLITLEAVYCLGLCHSSPAAILDGRVFARLDEVTLDALLKEAKA